MVSNKRFQTQFDSQRRPGVVSVTSHSAARRSQLRVRAGDWNQSRLGRFDDGRGCRIRADCRRRIVGRFEQKNKNIESKDRARLRAYLESLVSTAFRGSLTPELKEIYIERQIAESPDDAEAIRKVLLLSLKSPFFLYPTLERTISTSQRAANRLALTLHDSLVIDSWLWSEVKRNRLENEGQIREAARRMIQDYRTEAKLRDMLHSWLNIDQPMELTKDKELFPDFDPALAADLKDSLDMFLDEVVWSETSDYRQFFEADWRITNDRLHAFYGELWKPQDEGGRGFRRSVNSEEHRGGVLTHPYIMSRLAYHNTTSPIHRGVFLIRYALGRTLRPPNEAFAPLSPDLHPDLTTRERVALQTSSDNCQACHIKINGLGFALENRDAVGRYRSEEKGKAIDPQGRYVSRTGQEIEFRGSQELAKYLATGDDARRAFVNRMFQHFVKQPPAAFGADTLDQLVERFAKNEYNIRELLAEVAVIATRQSLKPTMAKH